MRHAVCSMLILIALGSGAQGCKKDATQALSALEFQTNAKAAYDSAMTSFYKRQWLIVPQVMEEVKRQYAGTRYARLAQLRIADAHFHAGEFAQSVTSYREFLRDYPNDSDVPYARYRVILCQFESRGESATQPPLEERDLASVRDAAQGIDRFLRDYPNYPEMERILYMRAWVRGMLARHELYVARFYLRKDNFVAAISRAEYALVNYSDTGLEPEALVLLGETYMLSGRREDARQAFLIVLSKYPESPFVAPSKRFLKKLPETKPRKR